MQVLDFPAVEIDVVMLPPESNDEMAGPTHKERLDSVDGRLGAIDLRLDRIDTALGLKPLKPKSVARQFFEHICQKLVQNWKVAVPSIAILLAVIGWFVNPLYKQHLDHQKESWNRNVDDRIRSVLNEHNGVNETLHEIQQTVNATKTKLETLEPFIHDVIQHQFDT